MSDHVTSLHAPDVFRLRQDLHPSAYTARLQLVLFHPAYDRPFLHGQVPLLVAPQPFRPKTTNRPAHYRPMPQTRATSRIPSVHVRRPQPPIGLVHVSVGKNFTVYRLNQVSFWYVPSSPFCFRSAALHSSISSFYFGLLPSNVAAPSSPPSSTRSLSRTLVRFSKCSLDFGHGCPSPSSPCYRIRLRSPVFIFSPSSRLARSILAAHLNPFPWPRQREAIEPHVISPFEVGTSVSARPLDDRPGYCTVTPLVRLAPSLTSRLFFRSLRSPFARSRTLGTATSILFSFLLPNSQVWANPSTLQWFRQIRKSALGG